MPPQTFQIVLLYVSIPLGIFLLVKGIKMVRKVLAQDILMEMPMSKKTIDFEIQESGQYAVWVKVPVLKFNHLDKIKIAIYNKDTEKYVTLWKKVIGVKSNDGSVAQGKFLTFTVEAGNYKAELLEGTQLILLERFIWLFNGWWYKLIFKEADIDKCFFQVRKDTPPLYGLRTTLTTVLGGVIILVSIVFMALAETFFE